MTPSRPEREARPLSLAVTLTPISRVSPRLMPPAPPEGAWMMIVSVASATVVAGISLVRRKASSAGSSSAGQMASHAVASEGMAMHSQMLSVMPLDLPTHPLVGLHHHSSSYP